MTHGMVGYVAVVTLLFFFWSYGLYAFVRDARARYLPAVRQYLAGRREQRADREARQEREEKQRELY